MPDSKTEKNIWQLVKDALVAAPVAFGVDMAFKNFMKVSADKAVELAKERIENQKAIARKRAEILEDLRIMTQQDPRSTENLWRRYQQAKDNLQENRLVALLGDIQKDQQDGRRPMLKFLNDIDDGRFWCAMSFLEHDWFMESLQRIRRNGGRIAKKDFKTLQEKVEAFFGWSKGVAYDANGKAKTFAHNVANVTDNAARELAKIVGKFADWLA